MDRTLQNIREALMERNNPDVEFLTSVLIDLVDIIRDLQSGILILNRKHTIFGPGAGRW